MELDFKAYLSEGTDAVREIIKKEGYDTAIREAVVNSYTYELSRCACNTGELQDPKCVVYGAAIQYFDYELSKLTSKDTLSSKEHDDAIRLCDKGAEYIMLFNSNGWKVPSIENTDFLACRKRLEDRQMSSGIINRLIDIDKRMDLCLDNLRENLSIEACDNAFVLLDELRETLLLCKERGIETSSIHNWNIDEIEKRLYEFKNSVKNRGDVWNDIIELDKKIGKLSVLKTITLANSLQVLQLCEEQSAKVGECLKNKWGLPKGVKENLDITINRFSVYKKMFSLDKDIISLKENAKSGRDFDMLFSKCTEQQDNISECQRNSWVVPGIAIVDPIGLSRRIQKNQAFRDGVNRVKTYAIIFGSVVLIGGLAVFIGIFAYRIGKVKVPFGKNSIEGQSLESIYEQLSEAGFENIEKQEDYSGVEPQDTVLSVEIKDEDDYEKDDYISKKANVTIRFTSRDRVHINDFLDGWEGKKYDEIVELFKEAGFSDVSTEKVLGSSQNSENDTAGISFFGTSFDGNTPCYLSKKTPIVVSYYSLWIAIADPASSYLENTENKYLEVVKKLKKQGFTNIHVKRLDNLWTGWVDKEGSVKTITISGSSDFSAGSVFRVDAPILIEVNTFEGKSYKDITDNAD